ncbi:MAG: L-serine ammonia-lyase, iron-sulfur-dependent, subunit beta [Hydrogenibacillus sp.]|nr:L-serine ammonia-lyase, iron-sulfur-dependent, subunit beta [Hydrogenibacillus sp.]
MKYRSVFDIIGPIMIGPSSSHTAGAVRIGKVARALHGAVPTRAEVTFYGSFAETYRGHGTDVAIAAGILDFDTYDPRIRDALKIAAQEGVEIEFLIGDDVPEHPNTARVRLMTEGTMTELVGVSIGGGKVEIVEIAGFPIRLSGDLPTIIVRHVDRYGMIAKVAQVLADHRINIAAMHVARKSRGAEALMTIEVDESPSNDVLEAVRVIDGITSATRLTL